MSSNLQPGTEDINRYKRNSRRFVQDMSFADVTYNIFVPKHIEHGMHTELVNRRAYSSGHVLSEVVRVETGHPTIDDELLHNMLILTGEVVVNPSASDPAVVDTAQAILNLLRHDSESEIPHVEAQEYAQQCDPISEAAEYVGRALGDKLYGDPPPLFVGLESLRQVADDFHDGTYEQIFALAQPAAETVLELAQLYIPPQEK